MPASLLAWAAPTPCTEQPREYLGFLLDSGSAAASPKAPTYQGTGALGAGGRGEGWWPQPHEEKGPPEPISWGAPVFPMFLDNFNSLADNTA